MDKEWLCLNFVTVKRYWSQTRVSPVRGWEGGSKGIPGVQVLIMGQSTYVTLAELHLPGDLKDSADSRTKSKTM